MEGVKHLAALKELVSLDMVNNPVAGVEDYRNKVYDMIPSLDILDGFDKDNNEVIS